MLPALDPALASFQNARKKSKDPFVHVQPLGLDGLDFKSSNEKSWKPITFRISFLAVILLVTLSLIALIQALSWLSEKQDGLIFAPTISEIPSGTAFLYLYLPTVLAVLYSLTWAWLDLDTKRLEPYRQLSRPRGAKAEDSLSLHYPHDFLATVPLKSLRRKHWLVFFSSCGLVLVAWGVTPLQAAIFATKGVTKTYTDEMRVSNRYLRIHEQAAQVTANYTYSSFGIAWLGERLPQYMSREAAFVPFELADSEYSKYDDVWTANTTLYSVDVHCENAAVQNMTTHSVMGGSNTKLVYASSHGCQIPLPFGPDGLSINGVAGTKNFTAFHAGNQNRDGYADFYLSSYCPDNASHVFMAAFARNRQTSNEATGTGVTLFCEPIYYQQNATVSVRQTDRSVVDFTNAGPKAPMPSDMFNSTQLEWQMNSARQELLVRGAGPPSSMWPDQIEQLSKYPLTLDGNGSYLDTMAGMAIGIHLRPMEDYLDSKVLADSYQAAYRLLFARAMTDVLAPDFSHGPTVPGTRSYNAQAVYVVPGFAYAVEGLLAVIALFTLALMVITRGRMLNLDSDPGTLTALMILVADQEEVLRKLGAHDMSDAKKVAHAVEGCTFTLRQGEGGGSQMHLLDGPEQTGLARSSAKDGPKEPNSAKGCAMELSWFVGLPFIACLLGLIGVNAYFWTASNPYGIALPSQNRFVRQMLENYIPTIIATLIEPVWVVLNRLLCVLQPFEELRKCNATPRRSIDVNYASLPPQLVAFKALGARHFLLAAVCSMALLANLLAVAFNGMFNEDQIFAPSPMNFTVPYEARFRSDVDGKLGPWGSTSKFGAGLELFYIAMANLTSSTPLPAWTDENAFYMPLSVTAMNNSTAVYKATTRAFSVEVDCLDLEGSSASAWNTSAGSTDIISTTNEVLQAETGCLLGNTYSIASPEGSELCSVGNLALEIIAPMRADSNAPSGLQDFCRGNFAAGWYRQPTSAVCGSSATLEPLQRKTTLLSCRPRLATQEVEITFDESGRVLTAGNLSHASRNVADYFDDGPEQLLRQASNFMFPVLGFSPSWHRDNFPSGWNTYIMSLIDPDSNLLDPKEPAPGFDEVAVLLSKTYTRMFAIWLGKRHSDLLKPAGQPTAPIQGFRYEQQTRIVVSKPVVLLSETVLALFLLTAAILFLRRPGRFLARLPTTISSCIAMFAASRLIEDVRMARDSYDGCTASFDHPDTKLGYGTFLGTDGKAHIGIERKPFVTDL